MFVAEAVYHVSIDVPVENIIQLFLYKIYIFKTLYAISIYLSIEHILLFIHIHIGNRLWFLEKIPHDFFRFLLTFIFYR